MRSRTMLPARMRAHPSPAEHSEGASKSRRHSNSSSVFEAEEWFELAMRPPQRRTSVSHDLFLWVCTPWESRSIARRPVEVAAPALELARGQGARSGVAAGVDLVS